MCDRPLSQAAGKVLSKSPKKSSSTRASSTRADLGFKMVPPVSDSDDDDSTYHLSRNNSGAKPIYSSGRERKM